ncbi:MAG: helix-turn-helix transcriptional regulator [Chthonomonadaceae bacterium]|nr:helix-turn-helix transcriptional regulator [Chthonomonadaceae bacterium]
MTRYAPMTFMARHAHAFDKVSVVLSGSVLERSVAGERVAQAGWIVVKPGGVLHEDVVGERGLCMLSLAATPQSSEASDAWASLTADYRWMPLEPCVGRLVGMIAGRIEDPAVAIEEVLFALAGNAVQRLRHEPGWLAKARSILEERHDSPPSLVALADEVAVHPVSLSRAFQRAGTSKTEIVHRRRVERALDALREPTTLGQVAAELGYADGAHFSRSFRFWMGCSPSAFRAKFLSNG